nr:hypothetical protein [Tanacetum cinerariifolium]
MLAIQAEEDEVDEAVHKEWDDIVERAATTAASLDVEQASGNINRTQSTTMPNVPLPYGIGAGGSPRCQEAMRGSIAQTRSERVPTPSYDSPLLGVHTPKSDEKRFKQHELMGNVQQQFNDPPLSRVAFKDKGKGKMEESEDERTKRTNLQQEQDRLGHEAVVRLQEEVDEEERQRLSRVYEATQSFTEED